MVDVHVEEDLVAGKFVAAIFVVFPGTTVLVFIVEQTQEGLVFAPARGEGKPDAVSVGVA